MTYLRCPRCLMTVRSNPMRLGEDSCPRCRSKLGVDVPLERGDFPVRATTAAPARVDPEGAPGL